MARFLRYTSTYGDGKKAVYFRAVNPEDQPEEDERNQSNAEEIASYALACELGEAGAVTTTVAVVD